MINKFDMQQDIERILVSEEDIHARIREVEQRTAELNNLIINFGTTDESVESAARAELRYPPDETIFVFHGVEKKK